MDKKTDVVLGASVCVCIEIYLHGVCDYVCVRRYC